MHRQIVLDTETTGLTPEDGHRIIEIGCIELINRDVTGRTYHVYLNPERKIDIGAKSIHGLDNKFLDGQPTFAEVAEDFFVFIKDAELIIHNAPFDIGFIRNEFHLLNRKPHFVISELKYIDTLELARRMHPGQKNNLDALCRRYKVDNSKRDLHGALLDASLLVEVYLRMTGGQGKLFEDDEVVQVDTSTQQRCRAPHNKKVPIIIANAEELAEHQKYLALLKQQSGKCFWEEDK